MPRFTLDFQWTEQGLDHFRRGEHLTIRAIATQYAMHIGHLSSTLADLGGVGEGILHAVPDTARNYDTIPARPGHERNLMAPYFATYRGDCIAEGQECFWIPGGRSGLELSRLGEIVRPEGDDGEQTE